MDRANALEEELRNLGNKLSRTEDEHRRTQEQLQVSFETLICMIFPSFIKQRSLLNKIKHFYKKF